MPKDTFYLTTPIYYVNARPHIGHAYTTIVADVLARRSRTQGVDTFFLTGTDEHGQKIERSAQAAGIEPQQFTDQVSAEFSNLWKRMGITNDDFIRTTDDRHKRGAQKLFALLQERGFIYLDSYTGSYCVSDEAFVDLPAGTPCPDCGRPLETITEENYFFKLSAFQEKIIDLIESGTLSVQPESRRNEVLSFVKGGLKDLSVSRSSFKWGIPVPGDEKHVIYVWLDALANYMTAIGYGSDSPEDQAKFAKYWPADLHLVGKEIIRFHCVYWPAFLMAAGLPLPKAIVAHGWLLFDNSKMSKSKGNIVRTETILDAFGTLCPMPQDLDSLSIRGEEQKSAFLALPDEAKRDRHRDLFASDVLRYFLLREIPFGQDGSFSLEALVTRYNADLANGYGNLVSRTLSMIHRYFDGVVAPSGRKVSAFLYAPAMTVPESFGASMSRFEFSQALASANNFITVADRFISDRAPWKLAAIKTEEARLELEETLYFAWQSIRIITALLYPILPYATASVWRQLGLGDIEQAARKGELKNLQWGGLQPGTKLGPLAPIFPRADKGLIQLMTDVEFQHAPKSLQDPTPGDGPAPTESALSALVPPPESSPEPPPIERSPEITIDDFAKIELRVAQILVAERIPKADKLLRLEVDLGFEKRQILSGIAEFYTPEELVGRRIVVITNLAPRKMRGLESHGMLLAASEGDHGKPALATCGDEIALGARLK